MHRCTPGGTDIAAEIRPLIGLETIARRVTGLVKTDDDSLALVARLLEGAPAAS